METSTNLEPLFDAPVATQSKTTQGRKLIQIVAENELKIVSVELRKEQKGWIKQVR